MSTAVETPKTLEERITARIHDQIGDLMTDDDLRGIIERGVEKALFKERVTEERDYSGYHRTSTKRALVDELVDRHLAGRMEAAINQWIKENPERMQEAVDRAIAEGVGKALLRTLDNRFAGIFSAGVEQMQYAGLLPKTNGM